MSEVFWLFVAFMVVWAGIGAYAGSIAVRQRNLERRLEDLRGSSDRPQTDSGAAPARHGRPRAGSRA
jgi:CcmD family protein